MNIRRRTPWPATAALILICGAAAAPPLAGAQDPPMGILDEIGIEQRLDAPLPLDAVFRDHRGNEVRLGDYFGERPVVLSLVYYECPMLCTLVLNGLVRAIRPIDFDAGHEYEIVTVSFDPRESTHLAAEKRKAYLDQYDRAGAEGWHFLTGDQDAVDRLTEAVGFRYAWDEATGQWAHASAIMVATPEGRLSRYFYGIEYSARDLRLGLVDAAAGEIGSAVDQFLLYCYHYDPTTGKYGLVIMNVIRLLGFGTVAGIGLFVAVALRRERRRSTPPAAV